MMVDRADVAGKTRSRTNSGTASVAAVQNFKFSIEDLSCTPEYYKLRSNEGWYAVSPLYPARPICVS